MQAPGFPFTAVVGQSTFKLALSLAAVYPSIGGVLISGPRGSAKSTLARALVAILPGQAEGNGAFVTLPLGATEEMLLGTLNLKQVLEKQVAEFQPGILSRAHQGILYVDEVNLLQDSLADVLLDVATSGVNIVERDGISHRHASHFVLLGTMNPDEGEIRPQLLDRFGLMVQLSGSLSVDERIQVVKLRERFDHDPSGFCEEYARSQAELKKRIVDAQQRLSGIHCSDTLRTLIAEKSLAANVEGLRADIVWYKAALAHAALRGHDALEEEDVLAVEELVLAHRRKTSASNSGSGSNSGSDSDSGSGAGSGQGNRSPAYSRPPEKSSAEIASANAGDWGEMEPEFQHCPEPVSNELLKDNESASPWLKNATYSCSRKKGGFSGTAGVSGRLGAMVNWFSTIANNRGQFPIKKLAYKKTGSSQNLSHIVVLDTSASTLKNRLFASAKSVILTIARQAYLARERLTVFGFGSDKVELLLSSARAPKALEPLLNDIPAGGGTPFRAAMLKVADYQRKQLKKTPGLQTRIYLITDGRTRQAYADISLAGELVVIDIEPAGVKRGKARDIAAFFSADYIPLFT